MPTSDYKIRVAKPNEIGIALDLAAKEGWNPGQRDAECFSHLDPNGFLIGQQSGKAISSISAVKYGDDFGFIGLFIVIPDFRGKGYGIQIWNQAMNYLSGRNIGLDGVVAQQDNYKRSGFKLAYRNRRYGGVPAIRNSALPEQIVDLSTLPFEGLERYDRKIFLYERAAFLRCWVNQPKGAALGFLKSKNELGGYGVVRPCRAGFKLSPLFADSPEIAELLFEALAARTGGAEIFYDPPEPNNMAIKLATRHGLRPIFETSRMYTQAGPNFPLHRVFSATTLEVG